MDFTIFKTAKYVTNGLFIKKALELKLNLQEFLMLMYFDNNNHNLDLNELSENLGLKLEEAYQIFNNLISKHLITINTTKDIEGRMMEKVSLDSFYSMISETKVEEQKEVIKTDIFATFEQEFGRTITSTEYEIINAWMEKGYTEELIRAALKEAVFNDVKNLRYIDKILYEWYKKGYKTKTDVDKHLQARETKIERKELFDYNWLDDED